MTCGGLPVSAATIALEGGGIADAHIPRADEISACSSGFTSQVDTRDEALLRLRPGHGRAPGNIARTPADANAPDLRRPGQFTGHTGVNNYPAYAETSGQYIDGSAISQEVVYHLHCDFSGIAAYALGDYTVVPGCNDNGLGAHLRLVRAEDSCQLYGDIFQATETALAVLVSLLCLTRAWRMATASAGLIFSSASCSVVILMEIVSQPTETKRAA